MRESGHQAINAIRGSFFRQGRILEQSRSSATLSFVSTRARERGHRGIRMERSEHSVLRHIQTIFESGTVGDLTDRQLLDRFVGRDRDMAELCFAALVERHGPMVLRTCQSILQNRHDAEDAFQATFLVLTRKARSLWIRDSLGPWLFQVARRVAGCARTERFGGSIVSEKWPKKRRNRRPIRGPGMTRGRSFARSWVVCRIDTARRLYCAIWRG